MNSTTAGRVAFNVAYPQTNQMEDEKYLKTFENSINVDEIDHIGSEIQVL